MRAVVSRNLETHFARKWLDIQGVAFAEKWSADPSAFVRDFNVDKTIIDEFIAFVGERGIAVVPGATVTETLEAGQPVEFTEADVAANREFLGALVKGRIAQRILDRTYWYPIYHGVDEMVQAANGLWSQAAGIAAAG
jgi:hypothetical protein